MRLIDADSLETHEIYEGEWVRVVYADDIDNAPTIDAEPVRRESEWKWCHDCKEYDKENHCCHRWSTMIRETFEAMQIIRCKDCKYQVEYSDGDLLCGRWDAEWYQAAHAQDYDYCSYAERKSNVPR